MTEESRLRDEICALGRSMFDRGLTAGASGNISARLSDGRCLLTPTGSTMGTLDPARLSVLSPDGRHIDGDPPTKEVPLHAAFYETRQSGAVVHLHSTHSVALSLLPDTDPDAFIPPLTAYAVMRVGRVKLLPFYLPGDPAMGDAIRGLAGKYAAVMLAHHGPVVAGRTLDAAANAMEELEETAKLALLTRGMGARGLDAMQIASVCRKFEVDW